MFENHGLIVGIFAGNWKNYRMVRRSEPGRVFSEMAKNVTSFFSSSFFLSKTVHSLQSSIWLGELALDNFEPSSPFFRFKNSKIFEYRSNNQK